MAKQPGPFNLCLELSDLETMRSFEESGDWEKLEVLKGLVWILELPEDGVRVEVERATRTLLSERPDALLTVEGWVLETSQNDPLYVRHGGSFQEVSGEVKEEMERKWSSRVSKPGQGSVCLCVFRQVF